MKILISIKNLFNIGSNIEKSKNDSRLTDFFRNRSLVLLILYSSIFISFPIMFGRFGLFLFGISLLIITEYLFKEVAKTKEIRTFQYILFVYGFWIIFSSVMHYSALSMLEPLTYITIKQQNVSWGLGTLKDVTLIYLLFPLLFFIAIYLFKSNYESYKMLYLLPIFIIPSLILAIYQGLVDIEFLNCSYCTELHRVSGLGTDSHGLGLSLFLLFPLCILATLLIQNLWKKLLFILLATILFWCLLLSGGRTGLLGIIIFICILPWIWVWANKNLPKRQRHFLILSPLVLTLFIGTFGIISLERGFSPSLILMKRLNSSYSDFKKGGIEKVIRKSGRSELGLQAYRLTMSSPLSGWGPGGFNRNLYNIRFLHGEPRWLFDNANNQYLQMSSELGLLGAFFNILLHLFPLWMVFRIRKRIQNQDKRWAIGITFATVGIMMLLFMTGPHTMAIEVLWILVVLLSFLFVTALKYGYSFSQVNMKFLLSSLAFLTILFFWGTYDNTFGQNGYKARQQANWWPFKYEKNCYALEKWKDGRVRWCKKDAFFQSHITKALPAQIKLTLIAHHPDIQLKPVTVKYGGKAGVVHEVVLREHSWKTIEIPVTRDYIFEFTNPNGIPARYFVLSLDVSRTWIPKEWGINDDTRELGVAVLMTKLNSQLN